MQKLFQAMPGTQQQSGNTLQDDKSWNYYLMIAQKGDIKAQLKLAKLAMKLGKERQVAGEWLTKAINAKEFDPNIHEVDLTPDDLFQIEQSLLTTTKSAYVAVLRIWNKLPRRIFEPVLLLDHYHNFYRNSSSYQWGTSGESRGKYVNRLTEIIFDDFSELQKLDEFNPELALAAVELHIKLFARYLGGEDVCRPGTWMRRWDCMENICSMAAPLIEKELDTILKKLTKDDIIRISINLNDVGFIPDYLEKLRNRVKNLAPYNQKCAQVYLDWHLQGNMVPSSYSTLELQKCAERFSVILPKMYEQLNFIKSDIELSLDVAPQNINQNVKEWKNKLHNYGDILVIVDTDNNTHIYGYDKTFKWVMKAEKNNCFELTTTLNVNSMKDKLNNPVTKFALAHKLNDYLDHRNFSEISSLTFCLVNLTSKDNLFSIVKEHNPDYFTLTDLINRYSIIAVNILNHPDGLRILSSTDVNYNYEQLPIIHLAVLLLCIENPKLIPDLDIVELIRAVNKNKHRITSCQLKSFANQCAQSSNTFPGSTIIDLINILRVHLSLYETIAQKLLKSIVVQNFNYLESALSTGEKLFSESDLVYIISNVLIDENHVKEFFIEYIFNKMSFENILQIAINRQDLALRILQYGIEFEYINFEKQINFARVSKDAAAYSLTLLENHEHISKNDLAQMVKQLALAQPSLTYRCGKLCLDIEEIEVAYEVLSLVDKNDADYEEAKFECANIQYCVKKNKPQALVDFGAIKTSNRLYHPVLIESCKEEMEKTSSLTNLYKKTCFATEESFFLADKAFPIDKRTGHNLFGCTKDKKVSTQEVEQVWQEYLRIKTFKLFENGEGPFAIYKKANSPIFNDIGRYRILREYFLDKKNQHSNFCKALNHVFGKDFFEQDNCLDSETKSHISK